MASIHDGTVNAWTPRYGALCTVSREIGQLWGVLESLKRLHLLVILANCYTSREIDVSETLRPGVEAFAYKADSTECVIDERQAASAALTQAVVTAGLKGVRVGVEAAALGLGFAQEIRKVAEVVTLGDQIEAMRLRKDDEELSLIRRAVGILDHGFAAARRAIRPGVSELEVYAAIHRTILLENNAPFVFDVTFASGVNTEGRLGLPTDRELAEGDLFLVDLYPVLRACPKTTPYVDN